MERGTDLPARIRGQTRDLHAVRSAPWPWCGSLTVVARASGFPGAGTSGELDSQSFAHKGRSILRSVLADGRAACELGGSRELQRDLDYVRKAKEGTRVLVLYVDKRCQDPAMQVLLIPSEWTCLPGTTSRASRASSYSMKPKPFMSLISTILPVPCLLKWASMSALVASAGVSHVIQNSRMASREPALKRPKSYRGTRMDGSPFRGRLPR